jgi:hypothetical protein
LVERGNMDMMVGYDGGDGKAGRPVGDGRASERAGPERESALEERNGVE